ncbi:MULTISPECIES: hypothetical protein [unclassified Nocardiopsis]|uniref:hypothetical protein n=1 Tax=unclassified Nocardiopsis TaxID=2649073 RepID=UPI00066C0016|nr:MULTISPECIES: hypothetical protein [unclassified Nocardiopsis]MBQ1079638.1 hypothetical protein [Nocardiopsis sp. B62]
MPESIFATHACLDSIVLYTTRAQECRDFYNALGLAFGEEPDPVRDGPSRYTSRLPLGPVLEIQTAPDGHGASDLRLSLALDVTETDPPLSRGEHLLTDPDGRRVDVTVL